MLVFNCTPLHIAARCGFLDIVKFLLMNGANIDERDNEILIIYT